MPATYRLDPGATTYPGSTAYPGVVGGGISLNTYIDLGDPTDDTPNWSVLDAETVRSFTISRGRETEIDEMSAGTATIVVDNRDRTFTPTNPTSPYYPYIRPMCRFRLTAELDGVEYPLFQGYTDSFKNDWPPPGYGDATSTITLTDEFKVLALQALPTTDPPRDTYSDLVLADQPQGYWPCTDATGTNTISAQAGEQITPYVDAVTNYTYGPIVGDLSPTGNYSVSVYGGINASVAGIEASASENSLGDVGGLGQFTVEFWANIDASAGIEFWFIRGPLNDASGFKWEVKLTQYSSIVFSAYNDAATGFHVSSGALTGSTWYHFVWTLLSGTFTLYQDGAVQDTESFTGSFDQSLDTFALSTMTVSSVAPGQQKLAHVAFYRAGFSQARVTAHYQAGTARGYPVQNTSTRINAVLDSAGNTAPRVLRTGDNAIVPGYMKGQSPLDMINRTLTVEEDPAMFFASTNGTLVFLNRDHRTVSPWSSPQATFSDDGTGLPYVDCTIDYSESFLTNEWNFTREGGATQTASDATSISRYFKRSKSETGIEAVDDATCLNMAARALARYKDPFTRITSLELTTADASVATAALVRELGDMIRIIRKQVPGSGGLDIDQSSYIQKIEISGLDDKKPWTIRFGVSPV